MAFPVRGFHTFSDPISRKMWGISKRETVSGGGAVALAAQPVASEARGQALRLSTAGAGSAAFRLDFDYMKQGAAVLGGNHETTIAAGWFRVRFNVTAGAGFALLSLFRPGSDLAELEIVTVPDGGGFRLGFNQRNPSLLTLGSSRVLALGEWHELLVHWAGNGALEVKTLAAGESAWTAEAATNAPSFAAIRSFRLGVDNAAASAGLFLDDFRASDLSEADCLPRHYISGSGLRDVSATAASPVLAYPFGLFNGATQARFTYGQSETFTGAISTPWAALSGAQSSILPLPVSGLTADRAYFGRFEIAKADGTIIHTSDTFRFHTLPAAGTDRRFQFGFGSCQIQEAAAHPFDHMELMLNDVEAAPEAAYWGFIHVGDQGYEAEKVDSDYGTRIGEPPETIEAFEQSLREYCADVALEKVLKAGVFFGSPDDHQFINDGDGRMAPGGSNENLLANDWTGDQTNNSYGATTTCGQLYVAGLTVFDRWFTSHWIGKAAGRYQARVFGKVHAVLVDTRTERIPGTTMLGATQKAWLKARISDFGASAAETLLIMAQGGWSTATTKSSEGFERNAQAEYREIIDHIYAAVPATKRVLLMSGDDHLNYCHHHGIETPTHPTMTAPLQGELKSSGMNSSVMDANGSYTNLGAKLKWNYSRAYAQYTGLRSSGLHLTLSADGTGMSARNWTDTGNRVNVLSEHTLFGSTALPPSVTIDGLAPGTRYYIQTQAVSARGPGRWSDAAEAETSA